MPSYDCFTAEYERYENVEDMNMQPEAFSGGTYVTDFEIDGYGVETSGARYFDFDFGMEVITFEAETESGSLVGQTFYLNGEAQLSSFTFLDDNGTSDTRFVDANGNEIDRIDKSELYWTDDEVNEVVEEAGRRKRIEIFGEE